MPAVAVVGTGFIGPAHVEALRRLGIEVRGVLGSSPEKSRQAAAAMGLAVAYADYQAVLDDPHITAVHIATPNRTHYDMATRALLAGKHVICEKPLAMTSVQTAEMVRVAQAHPHLVSAVNYNIRYYPALLHARELVQAGEIGTVYSVRGAYVQDWLLYDTDWNWRLLSEEGGEARAIGDIGTHWLDLTRHITGLEVESLVADLGTFVSPRHKPRQAVATFEGKKARAPIETDPVAIQTDDWGGVLLRYAGGARGTLNVSQVTAGRKNALTLEIAGSKGALAWDGENPNVLWIGHRDRPNEILLKDPALMTGRAAYHADYPGGHAEGYPDTFKQLYRAIYDAIASGDLSQPTYPTFSDGHLQVVLCERILQSHAARAWVTV